MMLVVVSCMQETNRYLASSVRAEDLIAAWSGLRPLVKVRAGD